MSWRTRAERLLHRCETEVQRKDVEERERNRWIDSLVELLESTKLVEEGHRAEQGSKYFVNRYAMGRRAATIRQHVRHGRRLQEYMGSIFGEPWLRDAGDLIAYIALRMEEPCGRTVPASFFKAVAILETSAEVPQEKRISASVAVHHFGEK